MAANNLDRPGPDHRAETAHIIHNPAVRKYIYIAVAVVLGGLVVFGLITEEQIAEWVRVTGWALGLGAGVLAASNTPTNRGV